MDADLDENLRASPGVTRATRSRIRELRYRVLLSGIYHALDAQWGIEDFRFTVNGASIAAARELISELGDAGYVYEALRDIGVSDAIIEFEGLNGAVRRIASWIHPSRMIDDEYPEHYPKPSSLFACAAELKIKYSNLINGHEDQIVEMVNSVIPLGMPNDIEETFRSHLD
jgi:hypothetical protein